MGKVISDLSMSLDGFIAGPNDSPALGLGEDGERLFAWYAGGDTEYTVPRGDMKFMISSASAEVILEAFSTVGALVTGRRTFDITDGWGGRHPLDVPVFVVTHSVPHDWVKKYEGKHPPFTFVTDGVESAIQQAKQAAGDKDVAVGAASIVQQCLRAGLLDEINIDLAPALLGKGVRLFEQFGPEPVDLEITRVVEGTSVTHLRYRVRK